MVEKDETPVQLELMRDIVSQPYFFSFFLSVDLTFFSSSRFRHGRTSFGRGSLSRFNNEDSRSRSSFLLLLMKDRKKRKKIFFCFLGWTIERDRGISTGHKGKPKDNRGLSPSLVSIPVPVFLTLRSSRKLMG